jgi:hypothetical protein
MAEQFGNLAATTLSAAITTTSATTLTVVSAAAPFPQTAQFRIIIDSEIMIVTAGAGTTTWTVTRGAENTTAATHLSGAAVTHILTAGALIQLKTDAGNQIKQIVTASNATSIAFTSIPSTYSTLWLTLITRSQQTGIAVDPIALQFNADTGSNYYYASMSGGGNVSTTNGTTMPVGNAPQAGTAVNYPGILSAEIIGYAQTTFAKAVNAQASYTSNASVALSVLSTTGMWNNTAAISSLTIVLGSGLAFVNGSIATLYGVN